MAKTNPFDFTNSINTSKKNLMRGTDNDVLAEKSYSPFLTNRALSYHNDTVAIANEMNTNHFLDKRLQYEFLLNIIRPKKRYAKWSKKEKGGEVDLIKEYYKYNDIKARQALTILTKEQISAIRNKLEKGGKE
jgi:hypothetical protein